MASTVETPVRTITSRARGWSRFLLAALALHVPLFAYPVLRLCAWLDLSWWLTAILFIPIFFSQILSRVYLRRNRSAWAGWLRKLADAWLGISPVLVSVLLLFEVAVIVTGMETALAAGWVIGISFALAVFGVLNALTPSVKRVPLRSHKLDRPLRFVQLSDVHIGSRSLAFLERIIHRVNQLEPDFVCITGDFIDASGLTALQLRSLKSVVGPIYFSIGNHEKYEDLAAIEENLTSLGVEVLRNRTVLADGLQFIGIDDMDDALQVSRELSKMAVDDNRFSILLYHRPRGLEAAASAGVDLMLSGHTHGGQIIPFNLVVNRVFKRSRGLYRLGTSVLYVSTGTGTWGPVMRLGTRSEITLFEVEPGDA
jgi:predicted MPP superfamily phosphohydrolase